MLAPGERDLDILPNTLTPERHLGYAVQWFGLALAVLVAAIILTLRNRKRRSP
jgi:cytochrome oxidase assembly protein ShyY1